MSKPRDGRKSVHDTIDAIARDDRDLVVDEVRSTLRVIANALISIESRICGTGPSGVTNSSPELMDAAALCMRLGVSRRWIQRHLTPTIRATPGGRAWFNFADVEAQLAVTNKSIRKPPRAPSAERRIAPPALSRLPSSLEDRAEVEAVEQRLRASVAPSKRSSR